MSVFRLCATVPAGVTVQRFVYVVGERVFLDRRVVEPSWPQHIVGLLDGELIVAVDVPDDADPSDGAAVDLRRLFGVVDVDTWQASGRARQLVEWGRTHRYCGRCATANVPSSTMAALECPACGLVAFPRLSPAMITLVTRGDDGPRQEVLLARGAGWPTPTYSCLAGFVEVGETIEQCVMREVREEVGVTVGDVTYRGSQPWPFPHSLMIGFRARHVEGDLRPDPAEIADAGWFRRDAMPALPGEISIARALVDAWISEGG